MVAICPEFKVHLNICLSTIMIISFVPIYTRTFCVNVMSFGIDMYSYLLAS